MGNGSPLYSDNIKLLYTGLLKWFSSNGNIKTFQRISDIELIQIDADPPAGDDENTSVEAPSRKVEEPGKGLKEPQPDNTKDGTHVSSTENVSSAATSTMESERTSTSSMAKSSRRKKKKRNKIFTITVLFSQQYSSR